MTENGWPPDTDAAPFVSVPLSQCVQVTIPGTTEVLWFRKGDTATILPAFMADLNAYIEPALNSAGYNDEGSWTNGNSVGTSNHLGATAFDYNWEDHPMGPAPDDPAAGWGGSTLIDGPEWPAVQTLLDWYEGTVFAGGNWDSPKDSMHFQMGYNTYDPATGDGQAWVKDFIARKIRPDGFSTYKRGDTSTPDSSDHQATVLAAAAGISLAKAAEILPTMVQGLALAQCNTVNRIAMFIGETREEADQYKTTEEYASGAEYEWRCDDLGNCDEGDGVKYKGRTWIQITGKAHYAEFGKWAAAQGLISDPNQFVNDPDSLADIQWAGIGAAWFWITPHAGHNLINDDCDTGNVKAVTYTINGGYNGLDQRTAYWNQALAQGDALLTLTGTITGDEDEMAGWTPEKVDRALLLLENTAGIERTSASPFRWPYEGTIDTSVGFARGADGNVHAGLVAYLAVEFGDVNAITMLWVVQETDEPGRTGDSELAAQVLLKVPADYIKAAQPKIQAWFDAEAKQKAHS